MSLIFNYNRPNVTAYDTLKPRPLQAESIFSLGDDTTVGSKLEMVVDVVDSLASITETEDNPFSLLPTDLNSTNSLVDGVLSLLDDVLGLSSNEEMVSESVLVSIT